MAAGSLVRQHRTAPAGIARLLDRAQTPPVGATYACPADADSVALLYFGYRRGPAYRVVLDLQGCEFASDSRGYRLAGLAADAVTRLVGADKLP